MTEKRFTLEMQYWKGNPQGRKLFDNLTGQDGMSVEELCNIASDLHSKCEELESVLEVYEDSLGKLEDENKTLKEENEQLKSKLEKSKKAHSNCDKLWWELHDEKEQLEKENKELKRQLDNVDDCLTRDDMVMLRAERGFE